MKKLLLFLIFIPNLIFGQINLNNFPEDNQLFARDNNNIASVSFSGNILDNNYEQFSLKIYKDGLIYGEKNIEIINNKFDFNATIEAGLFQYSFKIFAKKENIQNLLFEANNVVCGDAYIITGQSNSHASSKKSIYSSPFARSFGVKTGYETYSEDDKKIRWGLATGNCISCSEDDWRDNGGGWTTKIDHGIGAWGMELSKLLIEKHQIPVCIINGGSGSSTIEENMLYPEKNSLETSFGRLAYRVDQAKLKDNIKAIFYHQGESDATLEKSLSYEDNFDILNSDWKRVYKGLKKIYIFQIYPGCGEAFQSEIRETQNQIFKKYDHVEIMSTTAVLGHDGCHFSYEGYREFAKRILPLVSRDLFGEKSSFIITPPQLLNAYYSGEKEITLIFDQPIELEEDYIVNGINHSMKNQFLFRIDKDKSLINGVIEILIVKDKKIIIKLKSNKKYRFVTWPPNKEYLNTKDIYQGPWIKGLINNIGALTFDNKKINQINLHP